MRIYCPPTAHSCADTGSPQGGFSVTETDLAKIYGNNKGLFIMGREKAYGLWKKAPSRIRKKIGRQALWSKKLNFKTFSTEGPMTGAAFCPALCSELHAPRFLPSCNHRDQIDLRVVGDQSRFEMRSRNRPFIDANDGVGVRISNFLEKIGNGHPLLPRVILAPHLDHSVTPLALSNSSTSGKSIFSRLTVSILGIPSAVQPRRL